MRVTSEKVMECGCTSLIDYLTNVKRTARARERERERDRN